MATTKKDKTMEHNQAATLGSPKLKKPEPRLIGVLYKINEIREVAIRVRSNQINIADVLLGSAPISEESTAHGVPNCLLGDIETSLDDVWRYLADIGEQQARLDDVVPALGEDSF